MRRSGLNIFRYTGRLRNSNAVRLQSFDMEADRLADFMLDVRDGLSGRHAAGKVRHKSRIVSLRLFDDNRVWASHSHFFHLKIQYGTIAANTIASSAKV